MSLTFEEYVQEVYKFGKSIGWEFIFSPLTIKGIILSSTANNLNPEIRTFSREYIVRNLDWENELQWLKRKILK